MKKVIFLLVDSLMPNILEDCIRQRTVPAFQFLKSRGRYWPDCVTVFPTMTASVDSSLLTGVYPDVHRVPGLIWYDPEEKAIIDYVNGWRCVWKLGIEKCARNVLYNLNEKHLSKQVTTIFEELANRGKTSASINTIIHRGSKKHRVRLPFLIDLATGFRLHDDISGPDVLTLGAMVKSGLETQIPRHTLGLRHRCGINDQYAVHAAKALITSKDQPDFMLVYLPDNDHQVHKKNPSHAEGALIQVDQYVQEILNAFGSWDEALNQCVFIVTGDHGQTRVGSKKEFSVDLDKLLTPFRVLQLGEEVKDHDLVLCNNERSAYIYPLAQEKESEIVQQLLSESRIDLIAWKRDKGVLVKEGGSGREVYFEPGGPNPDIYGRTWSITGEGSVLDLRSDQGIVHYGDYPDALSRLYGALYSQDIPMIVITARPRYEFLSRYYPRHANGGCHGSLHKYDSLLPLIVAGTGHPLNERPRLVDLKNFILELFDT
ncbi:alkaline phosphatase family protein [Effusibacillus consociatus]|uniref:Alkaline phosphatase family protein n=1 Tax=Effusibacillus consociatus TaxID=1117041 RepID=A0ABV9PXF5_9BACL